MSSTFKRFILLFFFLFLAAIIAENPSHTCSCVGQETFFHSITRESQHSSTPKLYAGKRCKATFPKLCHKSEKNVCWETFPRNLPFLFKSSCIFSSLFPGSLVFFFASEMLWLCDDVHAACYPQPRSACFWLPQLSLTHPTAQFLGLFYLHMREFNTKNSKHRCSGCETWVVHLPCSPAERK